MNFFTVWADSGHPQYNSRQFEEGLGRIALECKPMMDSTWLVRTQCNKAEMKKEIADEKPYEVKIISHEGV